LQEPQIETDIVADDRCIADEGIQLVGYVAQLGRLAHHGIVNAGQASDEFRNMAAGIYECGPLIFHPALVEADRAYFNNGISICFQAGGFDVNSNK
jgi:hypothetical protein